MTAWEVIAFYNTAPGNNKIITTPITPGRDYVRRFNAPSQAYLITAWDFHNLQGTSNIIIEQGLDSIQGLTWIGGVDFPRPALTESNKILLNQGERIQVYTGGSTVGGDNELVFLLIYYEDLPGVDTHYITYEELQRRGERVVLKRYNTTPAVALVWEDTDKLTQIAAATGGGANFPGFKQNREYAITGITHLLSNVPVNAIVGKATGGMRYGMPGYQAQHNDNIYFAELARTLGIPAIPVVHGLDMSSTYITTVADVASLAVVPNVQFVELAPE